MLIDVDFNIDENLIEKSSERAKLKNKCKQFLSKHNCNFDKFTVHENDAYFGYIAEYAMLEYLKKNLTVNEYILEHWEEKFNLERIKSIVEGDKNNEKEIEEVKKYFYDEYDFKIKKMNKEIYIDVKTAITDYQPNESWDFFYPVIQSNKNEMHYVFLTYLLNKFNNKKIKIIGGISYSEIRNSEIIKKNERSLRGTVSQIDNYNTTLIQYKPILEYINEIFQYR